jgi:peptide/nickel transport system substrate-binding protein
MEHEKDGDLGNEWLKTNTAGSGAFKLKTYKAQEILVIEAFDGYRHGRPKMDRVILRHVAEPSAQRLLLEAGDIDIARNLTPDQIQGIEGNDNIQILSVPKVTNIYLALNMKHPILRKEKVIEAIHYVIDYDGMANSFLKDQYKVSQSYWPSNLWASLQGTPFYHDPDKAKALIAEAGYPDGFDIKLDTWNLSPYTEIAQSIQRSMALAGIRAEIVQAEGKTHWGKFREQKHEIIIGIWYPDFPDPHSNTETLLYNPDPSSEAKLPGFIAWRTGYYDLEMNKMIEAAARERDTDKRMNMYLDIQRKFQAEAPLIFMFEQTEQIAMRKNVKNFIVGPTLDAVFFRKVQK